MNTNLKNLVKSINNWNKEDVKELLSNIKSLESLLSESEQSIKDYIDVCDLESAPLPPDLEDKTGYPIWSCDKKGFCLVGDTLNEIEHVDVIRESYSEEE